jgi:hypothetical protein
MLTMFRRTQNSSDGLWVLGYDGPLEFTPVNYRADLDRLFSRSGRYVLLAGLHSWSGQSRQVLHTILQLYNCLKAADVAVGLHDLDNFPQLDQVDPELNKRLVEAGVEPALYLFDHRHLSIAWFGKEAIAEFQAWLDGVLISQAASGHTGSTRAAPGTSEASDGGGNVSSRD